MARYRDAFHDYERYQAAKWAYPVSPAYRKGMADFHAALAELEDRGLLQWDRSANTYDLHPVVRAYAFDLLEEGDRKRAFSAIGDHFVSRPPENAQEATESRTCRTASRSSARLPEPGAAARPRNFLRGKLSEALLFTVAAHHTLIELLTPLLGETSNGVTTGAALEGPQLLHEQPRDRAQQRRAASARRRNSTSDAARLDLETATILNLETGSAEPRAVRAAAATNFTSRKDILDLCRRTRRRHERPGRR